MSTVGGMKVYLFYSIIRSFFWQLKITGNPPDAVVPLKIAGIKVDRVSQLSIMIFFSGYILFLIFGTIIFLLLGYDFLNSSFQVTSALGTIGLSTMDLSSIHWVGKITLEFLLIAPSRRRERSVV